MTNQWQYLCQCQYRLRKVQNRKHSAIVDINYYQFLPKTLTYLSRLLWLYPGATLKVNGVPGNIIKLKISASITPKDSSGDQHAPTITTKRRHHDDLGRSPDDPRSEGWNKAEKRHCCSWWLGTKMVASHIPRTVITGACMEYISKGNIMAH